MANNLGLAVKPITTTSPDEEKRVAAWIDSQEYREKNFARQALVVNPAHACQPLGAELAAHGFEGTLPFVHGSQGCASYYRSTLNRHFREPAPAVSDSMTEDGAVFGGQNNLHEGLENAIALYKPKMVAVFTSCMPEIIGDDLTAFLKNARAKGFAPKDLPIPFANTPSFNGSHTTGYDAMLLAILQTLGEGKRVEGRCTGKLNLIPGFDANTGNYREYRRILEAFGIPATILADLAESFDSPNDGTYRLYPGGTPLAEAADAVNGKATLTLGPYATTKTFAWVKESFAGKHVALPDADGHREDRRLPHEALRALREAGARRPQGGARPRRRRDDRRAAVHARQEVRAVRRRRSAARVRVVPARDGRGAVPRPLQQGLEEAREGAAGAPRRAPRSARAAKIYMNRDLWHLRSLLMTDPVDALIGDTHGKFAARDAKIPLFRFGFPIFDRVNRHRYPLVGYQGVINMVTRDLQQVHRPQGRRPATSASSR